MIIIKPTIAFVILLIFARLLGKKQMSQMTFFNYVTGITIGSLAANIITFDDETIWHELVGLIWWCLLTALLAYLTLKSEKLRDIIDGEPDILIKKGQIQEKMLKKTRVSMEEITMMLREQKVFSIQDVEYAILEPNGQLSVLVKQDSNPEYLPSQIIINGKISHRNLNNYGLNVDWVHKELLDQGVKDIDDVFYAEIQYDGSLYILPKDKRNKTR